ncbi:uncharacterized protein METZ01_LOCUS327716, partial [marine metagenome]
TLILIRLTVTLVACCVTKRQEVPIWLIQIWRSIFPKQRLKIIL